MTTTTTETTAVNADRFALVCDPDQMRPVVVIDFAEGSYYTNTQFNSQNSITFYEAYGHQTTYSLAANVDAVGFDEWMKEAIRPLINRIKAGYSSEWNGNNFVAEFDQDATEAKEELEFLLEMDGRYGAAYPTLSDDEGFLDASDYLQDAGPETLTGYGITPATTEDEVEEIARTIDAEALENGLVLGGTENWIEGYISQLRYEAEDTE